MEENYKELIFRGDTKEFISSLDDDLKRRIGLALWQAQIGKKAPSAKPLIGGKDLKGSKVLEIVTDGDRSTYRTVYVVEFREAIYVKSKRGISTPQEDIDRIIIHVKALRKDREEPAAKTQIAELLDRYARRQQAIEEKRNKQNDSK